MPRNMSFSLTTGQIRNRTKTVTRRLGWRDLKPGQILNACVKCMGLKPGEQIKRLGQIRVVSARPEALREMLLNPEYGNDEARKEGFPEMSGAEFVAMFVRHLKPKGGVFAEPMRIEFEYVD